MDTLISNSASVCVSVKALKRLAIRVSDAFRCGYEGQANQYCVEFIDEFTLYLSTVKLENLDEISNLLTIMYQAQKNRDYLFVADIIEYEILPKI